MKLGLTFGPKRRIRRQADMSTKSRPSAEYPVTPKKHRDERAHGAGRIPLGGLAYQAITGENVNDRKSQNDVNP